VLTSLCLQAIPALNVLALGYLIEPQRRPYFPGDYAMEPLMILAPSFGIMLPALLQPPPRFRATRASDAMVLSRP
jgi:hypothetical protein